MSRVASRAGRAALLLGGALLGSGAFGGAAPGVAHAAQDPRAGRFDPRVRTVAYNPMDPVRLVGSTFTSTEVIFGVGETITQVAIGDSEAWLPQPAGNLLFIKPIEVRGPTNMQVVTTRPDGATRSYQFELIARAAPAAAPAAPSVLGSGQVASLGNPGLVSSPAAASADRRPPVPAASGYATPFAIQFVYPDDARQAATENRRREAEAADRRTAENRLVVDYFYGPRNWRYAAQGSRTIEPAEISDNGRLTAMRFPGNATVPTIYALAADGQETIVPYAMHGDVAVVSTTAREFRLRSGGEVTRIVNLAYDPAGQNPGTGTTSPEVVRTVREPRR